jgi:hypothetical protein
MHATHRSSNSNISQRNLGCRPAQYFNYSGALTPYYYWIGVHRPFSSQPFVYTADNSSLPQLASNSPYAHWSWVNYIAARQSLFDCVIAQGNYAYDLYLGDGSAKAQATAAYYAANDPVFVSKKYG